MTYLPFGGYRPGSAPTQTITDRDFTGQPQNRAVGLLYYQARFYVPGIGRFASADSLVPDPANPQSYNRYSYVLNSPLRFVDPTGHSCQNYQYADEEWECYETEQDILSWTIVIEILYQSKGDPDCGIGTDTMCSSYGHATIYDDQSLITHNHFSAFNNPDVDISNISFFRADGTPIPTDGAFTVWGYETWNGKLLQTLKFEFSSKPFAELPRPEFGTLSLYDDEVAQINWDGEIGSTYVQWTYVETIGKLKGSQVAYTFKDVQPGASGGGVFLSNGTHVGNNYLRDYHRWWLAPFDGFTVVALNPNLLSQ